MIEIIAAISIIFVAFILIPGLGGFRARSRWRGFRDRVMKSALYPHVSFESGTMDGPLGAHRFVGRIEALQGDDTLWLKGEGVSLRVMMPGAEIYLLPDEGAMTPNARSLLEERLPEFSPHPLSWRRITSLQEGSKVYVVGFLEYRDGVLRMFGSKDVPLLAILHEGEDVVPRAVWTGRQKNEYWNVLTPWSLFAGSLALFIMATSVFGTNMASPRGRIILTAALFPIIPLIPPGLVFFFVYLANWRRARFLRAERDLLGLSAYLRAGDAEDSMVGWGDGLPRNTVPLIHSCRRRALLSEFGAIVSFLTGFSLNVVLTMIILKAVT